MSKCLSFVYAVLLTILCGLERITFHRNWLEIIMKTENEWMKMGLLSTHKF